MMPRSTAAKTTPPGLCMDVPFPKQQDRSPEYRFDASRRGKCVRFGGIIGCTLLAGFSTKRCLLLN
jgi:hypothetical protein